MLIYIYMEPEGQLARPSCSSRGRCHRAGLLRHQVQLALEEHGRQDARYDIDLISRLAEPMAEPPPLICRWHRVSPYAA